MKAVIPICVLACLLIAQEPGPPATAPPTEPAAPAPAPLFNLGKPMLAPYGCPEEDMQWAGMACTEEDPCPVFLELSAVESAGNRLFVAGNLHGPSTTLYSVLFASEDAGKTWTEPYPRLRGSGFDHIQFADFEAGWISGHLLHPLTRDPFLLITSDGGRAWRQQPVFSESRAGTMERFWFESRENGTMLIESGESGKHELYESINGGESWMLREVSDRPIKPRRPPHLPNEDLRLNPHAPTKSYRVEKRQAGRWTVVASFLVPVAQCRPAPKQEPPPPPEEAAADKPAEAPAVAPAAPRAKPPSLKK
jgi:hypothetical protein